MKIDLELRQLKQLTKILNNSLDNPELFSDVNEFGYEYFDTSFHKDVKNIRDTLERMLDSQKYYISNDKENN